MDLAPTEMPSVPDLDLAVRGFDPADTNFIFNTWLLSFRKRVHTLPDCIYFPRQQALIAHLCQRSQAAVACSRQDPSFILGYVIAEPLEATMAHAAVTVHFAFTKYSYRKLGIARCLLRTFGWDHSNRPIWLTHWTSSARKISEAGKLPLVNNFYPLIEGSRGMVTV